MFAQSIGLGQLGVGLLVALPQVTKLLCNLPVGYLVDVVGRRPPLVLGAIVDALGQIMTAAASTMTQLVSDRVRVTVRVGVRVRDDPAGEGCPSWCPRG